MCRIFLLTLSLICVAFLSFGQTPGLIYKTAGTGAPVLDPNGDGYTSSNTLGFTTNDQTQSEIPYKPIPVPSVEPTADPGRGPDCGFTDFVDSGAEDPELTYFDGANLLFRMRIGNTAPNSKGYSILIDTDQKFGFSGPNADPDAVVGNPGFEIEISLQTNFYVRLYDVNGTVSPVLKASFDYDDYAQKSIALTTNCGTPDYFYDFYIPFAEITSKFPTLTTSTPLRMLAITTMNPNAAIGNNAQSDVGGIDDAAYGYNYDKIFETVVNNFYPTPITGINSGFPADRTSCPSITSSLNINSTAISGTSTEATGTTIKVFKNGLLLNTTTVSANAWTLSGVSGLIIGDIITASAEATGKSESVVNCTTLTVAASCSNDATINVANTNTKNIGGTGVTGATIKIYQNGIPITPDPIASATVAAGAFCWKTNGNTGSCNGGANTLSGGYKVTQTEPSKCESKGVYVCISGAQTADPIITTTTVTINTTSISGTSVSGATVELYAGSTNIGTATATGTTWTISGLSFTPGQVITAKATSGTLCLSNASNSVTVISGTSTITFAPSITGTYCTSTTISSISGSSVEAAGTTIQLYNNATLMGSTTTTATGVWTISGLSLAPGTTVTARATASGKTQSVASTGVTIKGVSSNAGLAINTGIVENQSAISGTLSTAGTVNVYVDGSLLGTAVVTGSTWSYTSSFPSIEIYTGGTITATLTIGSSCESAPSTGVIIQCTAPSTSITLTSSSSTLCSGSSASVLLNSSENGIIYQLYNGASTSGGSVLGTGGFISLSSAELTSSATLTIRAMKISPLACNSTLTASHSVTVTPDITTNTIAAPAIATFCGVGDPQQITGSLPAGGTGAFSYQWQSSTDNSLYVNIAGAISQDYDPPSVLSTTYYRRVVISGGCESTSPAISILITPTDLTNTITPPTTTAFCGTGDSDIINGSFPTGGTGVYTYQWQTGTDDVNFSNIPLATGQNYDPTSTTNITFIRRLVNSGGCSNFPSASVKIEVASTNNTSITAFPSSIAANGTSTSTILIQLKDGVGNNLSTSPCIPVLSTNAGSLSSINNHGDGTFTATLTSSATPGVATVSGSLNGSPIADTETINFIGSVTPSTAASTITASPLSITADGTSTSTIIVQLKDAGGTNLTVGGSTVALSNTLGTLSNVTDNGDGTYTAILTSATNTGNSLITGTLEGIEISDTETVALMPGAPDESTSLIVASPIVIVADGMSTTTITVQLKDANGNDLTTGGATVALSKTAGTISTVTDNGNGTYTATLTSSSTASNSTITGIVNGNNIMDSETVSFVPGTASAVTSTITASPTLITADGTSTSTITVQLKDANGNNLTTGGATIALSSTSGTLSTVIDNGDGTYTATLTSSTTAGNSTITGTLNTVAITDDEVVASTPGAASVATSTITASPTSIVANGTSTSSITVQLKDANGNNLTTGGATIVLSRTSGTLSTITDNGNGTYTATLTSSATAGNSSITGTLNTVVITDNEVVAFTPGAASVATSTITASPTSIVANGTSTSTITVQLKDANGNNITTGGATIGLFATSGTLSIVTDSGNGTYTATLTSSTTAATAIVTGTLNNTNIADDATVNFVTDVASGNTSTLSVSLASIIADGKSTAVVTIQLKDVNGNNLSFGGDVVTLSSTSGTLSLVVDNGDGTYTATLTAPITTNTTTITGTVNGAPITDFKTVNFVPGPASAVKSTITASPTSIQADGISTSLITIQLIDIHGNNIATGGSAVALTTTAGTLTAVIDHIDGTYTATLTSATTASVATIAGTLDLGPMTDDASVHFTTGSANATTSTMSLSSVSVVADGISTVTITIQLKDGNGNDFTTGGDNVMLSTTTGSLSSLTDNGDGTYAAVLTSPTVTGIALITGILNNVTMADTKTVTFVPGPPSAITSTIEATPTIINADGTSTSSIVVQLKDVNNNIIINGGAIVSMSTSLGTLSDVTDQGNGVYSAVLLSSVQPGEAIITGTLNTQTMANQVTVLFNATTVTAQISAEVTSLPADGKSTTTLTITVNDATQNPVLGASIIVTTTVGSVGSVTDNGDGTYSVEFTSGMTPGVSTISFDVNNSAAANTVNITLTPVFFIPEGFSPDGDGTNDTFVIEGADEYKITLRVFNRWGNIVYEANEYKNDWDGLATRGFVIGEKLPDGTYFYAIDLNNGSAPFVRYMTIKRK